MTKQEEEAVTSFKICRLLYATQSGRAKACARRVARLLHTQQQHCQRRCLAILPPTSVDEAVSGNLDQAAREWKQSLTIFLISTTGDGEPTDTMRDTWKQLLVKSLPQNYLQGMEFFIYNLGDRAYGPQFCAAGRKWAVRLLQLGATIRGSPGYGDDGTPGGGVLRDLEHWIETVLQPELKVMKLLGQEDDDSTNNDDSRKNDAENVVPGEPPYRITIVDEKKDGKAATEQKNNEAKDNSLTHLNDFFRACGPLTAYHYDNSFEEQQQDQQQGDLRRRPLPLVAKVTCNQRLTPEDWLQDTRHIRLEVDRTALLVSSSSSSASTTLQQHPAAGFRAGDVVSVMPVNPEASVQRFLSLLPAPLQKIQDTPLILENILSSSSLNQDNDESDAGGTTYSSMPPVGVAYRHWPCQQQFTLRQWLTYCADFEALPEREDLWALSHACSLLHERGADQRDKLRALSGTAANSLYVDYILRNKRTWADVLQDFDALRTEDSPLTLPMLISLLSPTRPREYSLASSPTLETSNSGEGSYTIGLELTVAVVRGTTPLGRPYRGLCSTYLASTVAGESSVRLWIRPGSFGQLPQSESVPVLYIGAGTGLAPLRGLLHERRAIASQDGLGQKGSNCASSDSSTPAWTTPDVLVFGCRSSKDDFYYQEEWQKMVERGSLTLLTAFSRDQWHKIYVQQKYAQDDPNGQKLLHHLVTRQGHVYIAGGAKMARSIKDELVEKLDPHLGGQTQAFLAKLQRLGRFRVEAWS